MGVIDPIPWEMAYYIVDHAWDEIGLEGTDRNIEISGNKFSFR